ncbi:MAG: HAMP domain-containing sensor histidine kinase [Halobacteriales archaeon]|nr:HAMP domain-containing sensor histidine kinase [Halobacteriales archaeon]
MLLKQVKRWSLTVVGSGAILLILGYSYMAPYDMATSLIYTSSPIVLSVLIAVAGFEIGRRHDEDFVASVALWAVVSGTLGVAINQWYIFLLGGALPERPFYLTVSSVSVTVAFGTAAGYFYTALQRKADELEKTNELLRDRNNRLDEFASVVSHDLRNPLNIARGYLDLARAAEDEDEVEDRLGKVENAHERMDRLIEEVLSFTRMGDKAYESEDVHLADVVERAAENTPLPEDSLELKTDAEIEADEEGAQRLFENLLRNAVEHGDEDVNVEVGSSEDCVFYVEDNGPGIPEDERDDVLEGGYTTKEDGTGFGLPIVRRTAEAHGWSVEVDESDEGGARFEFIEEDARRGDG